MNSFLDRYGNNIGVIVGIPVFVVMVIAEWDKISKGVRVLTETLDRVPLMLFKLTAIAVSGIAIGSIYWILIDFLIRGDFSAVLLDIISGAVWGIPAALFGSMAKNVRSALILSIITGIILLLLLTPERILPDQKVTTVIALLLVWLATSICIASGYAGFKTRQFLDEISLKRE